MSATESLDVWLYGTHVAVITRSPNDALTLDWTPDALARFGTDSTVLGAKLPVGVKILSPLVRTYLDGLLPEGNARVNHALAAGVAPDDTFALVRAYGRDTPGAAQIVESGRGDPTRAGHYEPLTLDDVADRLRRADQHSPADPTGTTGESSTLPGMVPKVTLHRIDDVWQACKGGAASTWILKRGWSPESGIADVIDTEVLSLRLARRLGLTSVHAEILDLGDQRAIAVSRYDRDLDGPHPRLHQEDLAQAIGLNTLDPNQKFQWGSAMPSLAHAHAVLEAAGADPAPLVRLSTFSYLVGNTDLHAKNLSFLRRPDGSVALAPAYDVAMHLHHARQARRFAMDVNGKFLVDEVDGSDLVAEARSWGYGEGVAGRLVGDTARDLLAALDAEDPAEHPGVSEAAREVVRRRTERLAHSANLTTPKARRRRGPRSVRAV